ncbi:uncharacterized protein LOC112684405 isoform X3 [Sipha flava]|uniref:Uncharacterized protein LOC112684405 isoform X3 n=1 Tax=Sipha flava TaxID=143950 RepID=A0A8B8FLC1_9HEMI|nr:uncharacterized protein LOC112684405 isoform X3 [Sipha flava]
MEVIPLIRNSATGSEPSNGDNGIKRHVQEWSRLDRLTGILEHARVEADQWTNHTANTKHKYGKVVDRRARNLADGSKEETKQTKQLEVFQAHTDGCSVQVIRSQTSTTSSWHNSTTGSSAFQWPSSIFDKKDNQFDHLRLDYSPLDVSSQKNKASIGRSGSISTRRPPTRRPQTVTSQLPRIDSAVDSVNTTSETSSVAGSLRESNDDDGSVSTNLNRLKSCSNDEIRSDVNESDEPLDRSSRFRRSLQFAQLKNGGADGGRGKVSTGELEDVLKKVLGKKLHVASNGDTLATVDEGSLIKPASPLKKPTFITVECLKKTKSSLRHLNDEDCSKDDDGIEMDVKPAVVGDSRSLDYRGSAKTEEWYNRRKSYGFEKVQTAADHCGNDKHVATDPYAIDSSTDSGICRSTENGLSNSSRQSSVDRESIADLVKKYSAKEINNNSNNSAYAYNTTGVAKGKILEAINSLRSKSSAYFDVVKPNDATSKDNDDGDCKEQQQVYTRRLSVGMDLSTDKKADGDEIPKRHSIAVVSEMADREPSIDKKNVNKKVEFCRTEVHFDATPGKINIVDMEDKPVPAQLYRPKKRYNRPPEKSHGLPEYRFGDDVHNDVLSQINGNNNGNECTSVAATVTMSTEDETAVGVGDGSNKPKSILKRQQHQQQQQQNGGDDSNDRGGVASDNGIEVRISSTESTPVDCRRASWSVADRVKQVEAVGFSTRVNFTEGETTAVGFDPADPRKHRYSYNGTASPVWYQNNGNPLTTDTPTKCHEKLLVRIGGGSGTCNMGTRTNMAPAVNLCTFSKCFGDRTATERLSSTSLVLNTARLRAEQPSTYLEEMNTKMQGRFQKAACSTSWPRYGHKSYPALAASRKYNLLKSCADIKRERVADGMPDVIGALDDLSRTIDAQIVDHMADRHVTLIKVRQHDQEIHGRLEYAKDLMSTDEISEESLKADEEVRSYMMTADCANEDDVPSDCENLKKLISTVKKNIKQSHNCSQDDRLTKLDVKSYESTLQVVPNVTSVLLNHEKPMESAERSQFQPKQQPSKRVPIKIVQDNRKNVTKPKPEISKTDVPVAKISTTVSLKQVPMTVQPKPVSNEKKKLEKKESIYGNIGYRAGSQRLKDKQAVTVSSVISTANKQTQDLFSTGRDSWLNMPKDLGPKLNKSKVTTYKSTRNRKETMVDTEVSVLEELNKAADEILKAVNGYTDDESQLPNNEPKAKPDNSEVKLKNKKKAARLLQRANSREALLHLDEMSSSDDDAVDEVQRVKPKIQRKTKTQQTTNSVATKTTASFTKKIQSREQNVTKTNMQHKVHPTYYGNVSSCTQTTTSMKFRNAKPSDVLAKQMIDQKDTKGRYQCKITTRTFNSNRNTKGTAEESKSSIKGC